MKIRITKKWLKAHAEYYEFSDTYKGISLLGGWLPGKGRLADIELGELGLKEFKDGSACLCRMNGSAILFDGIESLGEIIK